MEKKVAADKINPCILFCYSMVSHLLPSPYILDFINNKSSHETDSIMIFL